MAEPSPIFDDVALLGAGCDAYDLMHEMAVVYEEGSATDFNERQFVFELGNRLRARLIERDPESKHPFVAYEYHYPDERGEFRDTECDIVLWERQQPGLDKSQWIEVKSTGFKYGAWNNNFGGLDRARRGDFAKLAALNTESYWKASSTGSWVWLYQTTTYAAEFGKLAAFLGTPKGTWSQELPVADVSRALGKPNAGNLNLPKMLSNASDPIVLESSVMRFRADLKAASEGPAEGRKPLMVFIVVCSVRKRG